MGFLSFLSLRKQADRPAQAKPRILVKGKAYDVSPAPVARANGTYFVMENPPDSTTTRLQTPLHDEDIPHLVEGVSDEEEYEEESAPAPVIPRYRDFVPTTERPQTAPNGAGDLRMTSGRRQRESVKVPPVTLKSWKPKGGKTTLAGLPISSPVLLSLKPRTPSPPISEPAALSPQPRLQSPSTTWRNKRSQSTLSMVSGRGYIDLLDAQSELKPQGFHVRIKAAGVRDFGEDVADRNIIENGLGLSSSKSQDFLGAPGANARNPPNAPAAPGILRSRFGSVREILQRVPEDQRPDSGVTSRRNEGPFLNGLAQNPASAEPGSGPMDEQEARLSRHLSQKDKVRRRLSLSSYIPSAPATVVASLAPRPQSMHRPTKSISFSVKKDRADPPPSLLLPTGGKSGWSNYSHLLPKGEPMPPPSPSFARDSVVLAKSNYSLAPNGRIAENPRSDRPVTTARPVETEDGEEDGNLRGPGRGQTESARASAQTKQRRRSVYCDTISDAPGMKEAGEPRRPGTAGGAATVSPPRAHHRRRRSSGWQASYARPKGLGTSVDSKFSIDEIYGRVPIRTSSIAPASATSTATTASSTSSSGRPLSRHTPNTSIDLATISSIDSPISATGDGEDGASFWTRLDDRDRSMMRALASPTYEIATASFHSTFNIDDYFSSDDDANDEPRHGPRRPRGEDEGGLLFQTSGYGGLQLPGLYDGPPLPPMKAADEANNCRHERPHSRGVLTAIGQSTGDTRRDSYAPAYSPELDEYYSGQYKRTMVEFDDHDQTFVYEGDDDEYGDKDEVDEHDAPVVYRNDLAPGRKGTTRTSALGTANHELPEPIREETDEKVDIRTAVRMRKEVKARKRAQGERTRREQMIEKNRQQGHHALSERRLVGQAV